MIGICNTWSELTPCNSHFRELAEFVKKGVLEAGGYPVEPIDIHPSVRHLDCLFEKLTLTDKVAHAYALGPERVEDVMEMVRIAGGLSHEEFDASPRMYTNINSVSPLKHDWPMLDGAMRLARRGQPTVVTPFTLAGAMAPVTLSGAKWAPNTVTWTGNNRTHMVRVPGPGRFELRLPDGAANPYLLQAVIIAAGLDGLATDADPGKRYDIDMYAEGHKVRGAVTLPLNMLDALRAYDKDTTLKAAMGKEFSEAFLKLKQREWTSFVSHFSRWEKEHTLDI